MSIRKTFQLFLPRQNFVLGGLALALMLFTYLSFPLSEIAADEADTPEQFQDNCETAGNKVKVETAAEVNGTRYNVFHCGLGGGADLPCIAGQGMDACAEWDNPIAPTEPDRGVFLDPTIDTRYFGGFTIVMGW